MSRVLGDVFQILPGGNVGLGTTVPRAKLDIIGDTLISGSVSATSLTGTAISDSVSTTSSTIAASSTAVKSAYDLANAALPKAGGTMTGSLLTSVTANVGIGTTVARVPLDVTGDALISGSISAASLTGSAISDSIATTSSTIAASSTAVKSAYDLANAALPKAGGTMTGDLLTSVTANVGIGTTVARVPLDVTGDALISGSISAASLTGTAISDSVSTTSSTIAASSTAVKSAYDLANAALPRTGGTMTGDILTSVTANVGIGTTVARVALDVFGDALISGSISAASLTGTAISDSIATTSSTIAASSTAVKSAYDLAAAALPIAGGTMTGTLVASNIYTSNLTILSRAALLLPAGSNSDRPTPTIDGYIRYNQELSQFEGYSQNTWGAIGGASTGTGGFSPWSSNGSDIYYALGNVGIGTTAPLVSLDIRSTDALYLPSGSNSARPTPAKDGYIRYNQQLSQFEGYSQNTWGAIGGSGTTGNVINATDITTSNLTILNTLTFGPATGILKNRLQVNPLRKITYVETSTCNSFYLDTEGIFGAQASNVDVYIGLQKLLYYTSNITYYNVNYINTSTRTYYTINLTQPAVFGDLVDITVWPQFIEGSSNLPGYVYQQIIGGTGSGVGWPTSTSNDIYYILGNVGIGTSNTSLAKLTVEGDILPSSCNIYDLGSSNYRWRDIYLSGNTIDLGGIRISHDVVTSSLRVYKKSDNAINTLTDFYAKNVYTSGPIGVGTTLPQCKMHIFPTDTENLMQIDYGQQSDIFDYPPSAITGNSATISGQAYGNGAYTISSSSYYNPHQPYYVFDKGIPSVYSKWISQKFLYNSSGSYVGAQTTTHTTGSVSGEWLQIYLPSAIQIASYSIAHSSDDLPTNRAPYKWYLFGSTNGTTWVLLDTEDNYTSWVGNSYSTFSVSTTQSYTYYRWVFEKVQVNSADGFVSINEIKLTTGSSSIAPLFVATSAGNIGIGTNLPTAGLHVKGNARIDGNLTVTGSNITNINVINSIEYNGSNVIINNISGAGPALKVCQTGVGASYPIADFYDNDISISVPAFRIADGGNVGIGLTNPLQKLDVNGNINFTGDIYKNGFLFSGGGDSIPIGTIVPFYGSNLTDNSYLICDGSTYNRSTYTELANFLGISPSATTFQVPDLRDRFLKGKGTTSLVKDVGGSNLKMLTTANMPAHTHTGTTDAAGSHNHSLTWTNSVNPDVWTNTPNGTTNYGTPNSGGGYNFVISKLNSTTGTEPAHTHTFTTASAGSGTAFDIQPPYTVVNYIIKAFTNIYTTPIRSGDYWSKTASNVWFQSGSVGIATSIVNYPLDVNGNINFTGDLYKNGNIFTVGDTVPIGTIVPFYGSNLTDSSYLICDGSTYNRSTYTELANFLGISPSATTFQVPDLRDRYLKGKGTASLVKDVGGATTKTLIEANMPSHTHTGTTDAAGAHSHYEQGRITRTYVGGSGTYWGQDVGLSTDNTVATTTEPNHTHTFTTASTGSGTAFDIQPPYTVVNYIIKAFNNQYTTTTRTGDYWSKTASNVWFQSGSVGIATNVPQATLDVNGNTFIRGNLGLGTNTNYTSKLVPVADGKINGVNITALNARTRTSSASAVACVSTWTLRTSAADNSWRSVVWAPELSIFVAVANSGSGNLVMTSPDGITWTARTSAADNAWVSVTWAPELSLFVAVAISGIGNRVMTSPNGITWTQQTSAADNNWRSVVWAPELSLFVAVAGTGTGNRVMTSPNGITWTTRTSAADNTWVSVTWAPELSLFVAVAYAGGTGNRVMTSPDGITWTSRTSAADNSWWAVKWAPELSIFVAVAGTGTGNRVMTSPDGITWTTRTSAADNDWTSLTWAPELSIFVAVAYAGGTGNRIMTSPDGITWTSRTSAADNSWGHVTWAPELSIFVAVAESGTGNRVMTSAIGMPNSKSVVKALPSQMTVLPSGYVGIGTTNPQATLHVLGNATFTGAITAPGVTRTVTINLTAGLTTRFYPVAFRNAPSSLKHYFSIDMPAQSGTSSYNNQSITAMAVGGGWSDQSTSTGLGIYDLHHYIYDTGERSILGIYKGAQDYFDIVVYLRGGQTYTSLTNSGEVTPYLVATTLSTTGSYTSTFAIKDVNNADVVGTSTNIYLMWNGITATLGRAISDNLNVAGSITFNGGTSTNPLSVVQSAQTAALGIYNSVASQWIGMGANMGSTSYNGIVQAGDSAIIFSNGTLGSGALVIAPHAAANSGIRITNSGTTVSGDLTLSGTMYASGGSFFNGVQLQLGDGVPSARWMFATGSYMLNLYQNNGSGGFSGRGNFANGTGVYSSVSDARLKTDIRPIHSGLAEIVNLNPISYVMKEQHSDKRHFGFIAQEVESVIPEVVNIPQTDTDFYTLQYTSIVPILTKAIQELKIEVDNLKATNDTLMAFIKSKFPE